MSSDRRTSDLTRGTLPARCRSDPGGRMRLARQSALALATGLILGLSLGVLGTTVADTTVAASAADATLSQTPITGGTFARLAEAVKPAVINVTVQRRAPNRPADIRGLGSGVIIDRSGIALTNAHV